MNGRQNVHRLSLTNGCRCIKAVKGTVKGFKLSLTTEIEVNEQQNFHRLNLKTVLDTYKLVQSQIKQCNGQL